MGNLLQKYFHGQGKTKNYFEGWYLKHQNGVETVAFIPAFHIDEEGKCFSSLQIITDTESYYIPFQRTEFYAGKNKFYVKLGNNVFSEKGCILQIETPELTLKGKLIYKPFTKLHGDIMGPFRWLPGMQCRHGVLSLFHRLDGKLTLNGWELDFQNGMGYIEKDRGSSFPKKYLWTQCNWRQKSEKGEWNCCVMVSAAHIPIRFFSFEGCIACVWWKGRQYRFATYYGAKILQWDHKSVHLIQKDMELRAEQLEEVQQKLKAPEKGKMIRNIHESVSCLVRYQFRVKNEILFDVVKERGSFEFADLRE